MYIIIVLFKLLMEILRIRDSGEMVMLLWFLVRILVYVKKIFIIYIIEIKVR